MGPTATLLSLSLKSFQHGIYHFEKRPLVLHKVSRILQLLKIMLRRRVVSENGGLLRFSPFQNELLHVRYLCVTFSEHVQVLHSLWNQIQKSRGNFVCVEICSAFNSWLWNTLSLFAHENFQWFVVSVQIWQPLKWTDATPTNSSALIVFSVNVPLFCNLHKSSIFFSCTLTTSLSAGRCSAADAPFLAICHAR